MSRASRLRAVLFTDGASYAERLDAARRAVARASADDADADESAIVLAWTRAALRDAARDRGATRETGRDAPTSDERRGDETLWRCFADASDAATTRESDAAPDARSGRRDALRALRWAAAAKKKTASGETLRRAFDGADARRRRRDATRGRRARSASRWRRARCGTRGIWR